MAGKDRRVDKREVMDLTTQSRKKRRWRRASSCRREEWKSLSLRSEWPQKRSNALTGPTQKWPYPERRTFLPVLAWGVWKFEARMIEWSPQEIGMLGWKDRWPARERERETLVRIGPRGVTDLPDWVADKSIKNARKWGAHDHCGDACEITVVGEKMNA